MWFQEKVSNFDKKKCNTGITQNNDPFVKNTYITTITAYFTTI